MNMRRMDCRRRQPGGRIGRRRIACRSRSRHASAGLCRHAALLAAAFALGGCAANGPMLRAPDVTLTSVQLEKLRFDRQTFVLGFEVMNPNPFPLPVRNVRYEVLLDGNRFAGGETRSDFVVASRSAGAFAISVDLDLLQTASTFDSLLNGGLEQIVSYELNGTLGVDIPFATAIPFAKSGRVSLGRDGL